VSGARKSQRTGKKNPCLRPPMGWKHDKCYEAEEVKKKERSLTGRTGVEEREVK